MCLEDSPLFLSQESKEEDATHISVISAFDRGLIVGGVHGQVYIYEKTDPREGLDLPFRFLTRHTVKLERSFTEYPRITSI